MKTLVPAAIITFLILTVPPLSSADEPYNPGVGEYFKPFSGPAFDGQSFHLENHYNTGKYIFIDFWAYW